MIKKKYLILFQEKQFFCTSKKSNLPFEKLLDIPLWQYEVQPSIRNLTWFSIMTVRSEPSIWNLTWFSNMSVRSATLHLKPHLVFHYVSTKCNPPFATSLATSYGSRMEYKWLASALRGICSLWINQSCSTQLHELVRSYLQHTFYTNGLTYKFWLILIVLRNLVLIIIIQRYSVTSIKLV